MRYKFSLNARVRGYIEWQLEHYHEDKRQLEEYKRDLMPRVTPNYSPQTGGTGISNPTESAVIRMLTSQHIGSLERSTAAITRVLAGLDETDKRMIDLVYWKRSHTIEGAGMKVGLSRRGAYHRINNILSLISLEMGYADMGGQNG